MSALFMGFFITVLNYELDGGMHLGSSQLLTASSVMPCLLHAVTIRPARLPTSLLHTEIPQNLTPAPKLSTPPQEQDQTYRG